MFFLVVQCYHGWKTFGFDFPDMQRMYSRLFQEVVLLDRSNSMAVLCKSWRVSLFGFYQVLHVVDSCVFIRFVSARPGLAQMVVA